jgi:hypothetical protein
MLLSFGFGYWVFVAGMLGFTSYLASWVWWMPITRVFAFPYVFAGVLLSVVAVRWLPRRFGSRLAPAGWAAVALALAGAQLSWLPIQQVFGPSESEWLQVKAESVELGGWYAGAAFDGHAIGVPNDRADITYALARYGGVQGKHLVSEMYDPFAYLPSGYTYAAHRETVDTLMRCWLTSTDIRMLAVPDSDPDLARFVASNPSWFSRVGFMEEAKWDVEAVAVPGPAAAECQAAKATVR